VSTDSTRAKPAICGRVSTDSARPGRPGHDMIRTRRRMPTAPTEEAFVTKLPTYLQSIQTQDGDQQLRGTLSASRGPTRPGSPVILSRDSGSADKEGV
jgi:hypothetical protein